MVNKHSTHSWLGSFAGRLMQLRPDLTLGSAVHCAVEHMHRATDLDPQSAAEEYARLSLTARSIAQRRASAQRANASGRYRDLFGSTPLASNPESRRAEEPAASGPSI
jgi:hypothetical protein